MWLPGSFASLAAAPPAPGLYVFAMPYLYNGSQGGSKSFPIAGEASAHLNAQAGVMTAMVGYAPKTPVLGGQFLGLLAFAGGFSSVQLRAAVPIGSRVASIDRGDSVSGGSDLYPFAAIYWNRGVHNWMTYLLGSLPVGAYDSNRLANLGLGHFGIDLGGGYTYLNEKSGLQASGILGFTVNFENGQTNYTSGVDSHLDWAVSQFLSDAFYVGPAGYAYWQLSPDHYPTSGLVGRARSALLGDNRSGVASFGGEAGAVVKFGSIQGQLSLRGYWEFWAENRPQGYSLITQLNVPVFN